MFLCLCYNSLIFELSSKSWLEHQSWAQQISTPGQIWPQSCYEHHQPSHNKYCHSCHIHHRSWSLTYSQSFSKGVIFQYPLFIMLTSFHCALELGTGNPHQSAASVSIMVLCHSPLKHDPYSATPFISSMLRFILSSKDKMCHINVSPEVLGSSLLFYKFFADLHITV